MNQVFERDIKERQIFCTLNNNTYFRRENQKTTKSWP